MSIGNAIKHARKCVFLGRQDNQWVVYSWSQKHNATWTSHPMDYWAARAYAREDMISRALEYLQIEDAGAEANVLAQHEGRWTDLVREAIKREAHRRATNEQA